MLRAQIATTALSIAATASSVIDGDLHSQLNQAPEEDDRIYKELEAKLRKIRDANRRDDVQIKFVYTLMPSPKDKDSIIFGVDAEEEGPDKSLLGDIYKQKDDPLVEPTRFDVNQVQPVFVEDQWGTWLTANSPIRSNTGDSVGVVGVDIDAKRVIEELKMLRTLGFLPCSCPLF